MDNLAQFDVQEIREKFAAESKPCQNLEDDYVTKFLDGILRNPEECSPDVSNACCTLFPYYSYSPSEAFFIRDNTTAIGGDNKDMSTDVSSSLLNPFILLVHVYCCCLKKKKNLYMLFISADLYAIAIKTADFVRSPDIFPDFCLTR